MKDEKRDGEKPKMSKAANRLTTKKIEALLRKGTVGRFHDGHGLMLEIREGKGGVRASAPTLPAERQGAHVRAW
ncbi:MAG: hypothetical protein ACXW3Y_12020, partial [Rhodoplanes sp.]